MVRHPLDAVFNPRSIAVVGASTVLHKAGGRRFRSLAESGFEGSLYPIHPTAPEVLGHKAYRSLRAVPGAVDLAVIMVRAELVAGAIADCAALGIPGVLVITAGFGETGETGREEERRLVATLRAGGGRMVGPNCAGLFSGSGRVNVLGWRTVPRGPIALVSQSGNMAITFAQKARAHGSGFSKVVSIGNAADFTLTEYLEYLFGDPETTVLLVYVEGFAPLQGRALYRLLREHPARKPVIVLKPGVTESGRRAALSHTGSLAGEERVVDAALRQCGAHRVADAEEAWAAAVGLATLPPVTSSGVVVVSDGGGHATIVCDTAARVGLTVPPLSAATQTALGRLLPPRSTIVNPVDFAGVAEDEPETVPPVIDACLADDGIGALIFAGHFGGYFKNRTEETAKREEAAARALAAIVRRHGKPMILHSIYGTEPLPALETLRNAGVPVYESLDLSARALAVARREFERSRRAAPGSQPRSRPTRADVDAVLARAQGTPSVLAEPEARQLLQLYDVPVPPFRTATSADDAEGAAKDFGVPLALKLISPGVIHKSDIGGVLLGVDGPAAAAARYRRLMALAERLGARDARVLVTPMIGGGVEVVVGAFRDMQFGGVVMCGLGGVLVEALDDIAFRLAPLTTGEARDMLGGLRAAKLFGGFRGRPPLDLQLLAELVVRVSELVDDVGRIAELDLNPVLVSPAGAAIADARVVLA